MVMLNLSSLILSKLDLRTVHETRAPILCHMKPDEYQ